MIPLSASRVGSLQNVTLLEIGCGFPLLDFRQTAAATFTPGKLAVKSTEFRARRVDFAVAGQDAFIRALRCDG